MKRRLNAKVIKFQKTKEQVVKDFEEWKGHFFSPPEKFYDEIKIHKIFAPFWIFDAAIRADYIAMAKYKYQSVEFSHKNNSYYDVFRYKNRIYHAEHFCLFILDII